MAAAGAPGCRHCGAPDVVLEWQERFGVLVCSVCSKRNEKLISKSHAKEQYLLSDSDLYSLGYIEKQNPRHQKFANMKQHLVSQVEEVAIAKFGSLDALEAERQQRMQAKLQRRSQKRQAAEEEEERQRRHAAQLKATFDKYAVPSAEGHCEADAEPTNPVTGKRKKSFEVDLAGVEVEEF